jgi:5-methylcytosine-specific restriction endonuclease McrA
MLLKPCGRCGRPILYGVGYCSECAPIVQAQREERIAQSKRESNRRYNQKRDPKYVRFYNSKEWRVLSLSRLQYDNYKCVKCGAIASEVDHIKPIQTPEGWTLRLEFNNTRSLCLECHNKRHNRFNKRV